MGLQDYCFFFQNKLTYSCFINCNDSWVNCFRIHFSSPKAVHRKLSCALLLKFGSYVVSLRTPKNFFDILRQLQMVARTDGSNILLFEAVTNILNIVSFLHGHIFNFLVNFQISHLCWPYKEMLFSNSSLAHLKGFDQCLILH
jgi:hypothetical protein